MENLALYFHHFARRTTEVTKLHTAIMYTLINGGEDDQEEILFILRIFLL